MIFSDDNVLGLDDYAWKQALKDETSPLIFG